MSSDSRKLPPIKELPKVQSGTGQGPKENNAQGDKRLPALPLPTSRGSLPVLSPQRSHADADSGPRASLDLPQVAAQAQHPDVPENSGRQDEARAATAEIGSPASSSSSSSGGGSDHNAGHSPSHMPEVPTLTPLRKPGAEASERVKRKDKAARMVEAHTRPVPLAEAASTSEGQQHAGRMTPSEFRANIRKAAKRIANVSHSVSVMEQLVNSDVAEEEKPEPLEYDGQRLPLPDGSLRWKLSQWLDPRGRNLYNRSVVWWMLLHILSLSFFALDPPSYYTGGMKWQEALLLVWAIVFTLDALLFIIVYKVQVILQPWFTWRLILIACDYLLVFRVLMLPLSALRPFRILRMRRPFPDSWQRANKLVATLQNMSHALVNASRSLLRTGLLLLFLMVMFASYGLYAFTGSLRRTCVWEATGLPVIPTAYCSGGKNFGHQCNTGQVCVQGENPNYGFNSFDHVGTALMAVFQGVTQEGWLGLMHPLRESEFNFSFIFFVALIIIISFLALSLVIAGLAENYSEARSRLDPFVSSGTERSGRQLWARARSLLLGNNFGLGLGEMREAARARDDLERTLREALKHSNMLRRLHRGSFMSSDTWIGSGGSLVADHGTLSMSLSTSSSGAGTSQHLLEQVAINRTRMRTQAHNNLKGTDSPADKMMNEDMHLAGASTDTPKKQKRRSSLHGIVNGVKKLMENEVRIQALNEREGHDVELDTSVSIGSSSAAGAAAMERRRRKEARQRVLAAEKKQKAGIISLVDMLVEEEEEEEELSPARMRVRSVVNSATWKLIVTVLIIGNAFIFGLRRKGMSSETREVLVVLDQVFTLVFLGEVVLMIYGLGATSYFRLPRHRVDFVLVMLGIPNLVLFLLDGESAAIQQVAEVLNIVSIGRVVRVLFVYEPTRVFLGQLVKMLRSFRDLFWLIFMILATSALFANLTFRGLLDGVENTQRLNYDTFPDTLLTLFVLMAGDDWQTLLFDGLRTSRAFTMGVFITAFMTFMKYVILNMIVAAVLGDLDESDYEKNVLQKKEYLQKRLARLRQVVLSGEMSTEQSQEVREIIESDRQTSEMALNLMAGADVENPDEYNIHLDGPMWVNKLVEQWSDMVGSVKEWWGDHVLIRTVTNNSLGVFGLDSNVRMWCASVVYNVVYFWGQMLLIAVYTVHESVFRPAQVGWDGTNEYYVTCEALFFVWVLVDVGLEVITHGLVYNARGSVYKAMLQWLERQVSRQNVRAEVALTTMTQEEKEGVPQGDGKNNDAEEQHMLAMADSLVPNANRRLNELRARTKQKQGSLSRISEVSDSSRGTGSLAGSVSSHEEDSMVEEQGRAEGMWIGVSTGEIKGHSKAERLVVRAGPLRVHGGRHHHHHHGTIAFLRRWWKIVDVLFVLVQVLSFALGRESPAGYVVSVIRVILLAYLFVPRSHDLQSQVGPFVQSLPGIFNVMLFAIVFGYTAACIGVALYAGKLDECTDTSVNGVAECVGTFVNSQGILVPRAWYSPEQTFDDVLEACRYVFELASTDNMIYLMFQLMDVRDVGLQPKDRATPLNALFVVIVVVLGAFFVVQLFVGVVVDLYYDRKDIGWLTSKQRNWRAIQSIMGSTFSNWLVRVPRELESVRGVCYSLVVPCHLSESACMAQRQRARTQSAGEARQRRRSDRRVAPMIVTGDGTTTGDQEDDGKEMQRSKGGKRKRRSGQRVMPTSYRVHRHRDRWMHKVHGNWETGVLALLCFHVVVMCTFHFGMRAWMETALFWTNYTISVLYTIDLVLKMIASGPRNYLRNGWNVFEFVAVVGGLLFESIEASGRGGTLLPSFRPSKEFRFLVFVRLAYRVPNLQTILVTFRHSFITVFSLTWVFLLLMYTFAIVFVQVFGTTKKGLYLDKYSNFGSTSIAMLTLFGTLTGENWSVLMADLSLTEPYCTAAAAGEFGYGATDCGQRQIAVGLVVFLRSISAYIFLNLLVAVVLQRFSFVYDTKLTSANFVEFHSHWISFARRWHPEGVFLKEVPPEMPLRLLQDFVRRLPPPLGHPRENEAPDGWFRSLYLNVVGHSFLGPGRQGKVEPMISHEVVLRQLYLRLVGMDALPFEERKQHVKLLQAVCVREVAAGRIAELFLFRRWQQGRLKRFYGAFEELDAEALAGRNDRGFGAWRRALTRFRGRGLPPTSATPSTFYVRKRNPSQPVEPFSIDKLHSSIAKAMVLESAEHRVISNTLAQVTARAVENLGVMVPRLEMSSKLIAIVVSWVLRSHRYFEASTYYETSGDLVLDEAVWRPIHRYLDRLTAVTTIVRQRAQKRKSVAMAAQGVHEENKWDDRGGKGKGKVKRRWGRS